MKVIGKQKNSKMCFICGLDNPYSMKAQFYDMEDGSVISPITYKPYHQGFPQRVHGGLIVTILDELACRAFWHSGNYQLGVTTNFEIKYRKQVPYDIEILAHGLVVENKSRMFKTLTKVMDKDGTVFAEGLATFLKLPVEKIAKDVSLHEEMPYLIEDGITEIDFNYNLN